MPSNPTLDPFRSLLVWLPVLLAIETQTKEARTYMRPQHRSELDKPNLGAVEMSLDLLLQRQSWLKRVGVNYYDMNGGASFHPLLHKPQDMLYSFTGGSLLG